VNYAVITALALAAYRLTVVRKMVSQYPWRYEQVSLWSFREKASV
jgi:hypothetical protein